jgi:hypothetical protein
MIRLCKVCASMAWDRHPRRMPGNGLAEPHHGKPLTLRPPGPPHVHHAPAARVVPAAPP